MVAAVSARGVSQKFGSHEALKSVSLEVQPGEVVAILGPNGAGKTTFIDTLLGLTRPSSGELTLYGVDPRTAVRRGQVGAILQTGGLLPDITVRETVRMIAATHRRPRPIAEVMAAARLEEIADQRVRTCSGGEKQRLKFALALLADPALIIFDEPTTGMDPSARHDFWEDIYRRAEGGTTIIFTTHYLEEAERFAQRVVFLAAGQIVADGSAAQVRVMVADPVVEFSLADASFLQGWSLPGHERVGERHRVRVPDSDAFVRRLLTETPAADVRVSSATLDDVFRSLTQPEPGPVIGEETA